MTFRRVATLAAQLRPGSRLAAARMADDAWSGQEYLLAALVDAVALNTWVTMNHGVERSKQSQRPEPMSRPSDIRAAREHEARQLEHALAFRARMAARADVAE